MSEPVKPRRAPGRRFLAAQARSGNGHGYVTQPPRKVGKAPDSPEVVEQIAAAVSLTDEPECISPAILDAYGEDARHYQSLRRLAEVQEARAVRATLSAAARLADVRRRAKEQHVNLSGQVKMVASMLDRAEAGGRKEPPAALRTLTVLEAQLDGVDDGAEAA